MAVKLVFQEQVQAAVVVEAVVWVKCWVYATDSGSGDSGLGQVVGRCKQQQSWRKLFGSSGVWVQAKMVVEAAVCIKQWVISTYRGSEGCDLGQAEGEFKRQRY